MKRTTVSALVVALLALVVAFGGSGDELEQGFVNPPEEARPRVWWHWTGGNVTKEGITKDLEWMKRVGIGGAHLADIGMEGGQRVEPKLEFFTPAWLDAVRHAAAEADRLGLELALFSSSGWSLTGGPWVEPEQAMKRLVWSETSVSGPGRRRIELPRPVQEGDFYRDSALVAYRTPADERSMARLRPRVTAGGPVDGALLVDGDEATGVKVPGEAAWVLYEFPAAVGVKGVTLIAPGRGVPFGRVEGSEDGESYRTLVQLPGAVQYRARGLKTYAFPETRVRFVRLVMTGAAPDPDAVIYQTPPKPAPSYAIHEFVVHTGARIDRWQDKAGFSLIYDYGAVPTPEVAEGSAIGEVLDLTPSLRDGVLDWDAPGGEWTLLRMGYALVGSRNRSATAAGTGLEVDKLSARHVESYFRAYLGPIERALGALVGRSLRYLVMDSWEAGVQNWTEEMIDQFRQRRGYDPTPYLPALVGRVVKGSEESDRFLWDFRRTLVEEIADAHYGTMARLAREKGMGIYGEAPGVSMEILEDTLLTKSRVDIPMGEFWLGKMHPPAEYYADVRMAAASAHVYGKRWVAAESFTGGGYDPPAVYKNLADYWFAQGVNRIVFHSSAHQPLDTAPGNTMVGTHFNRNITWAEQASGVVGYLGRVSHMLSEGRFVADLAYLLDEGAPSSQPFWGAGLQPTPPEGYDYDTINADALLHRVRVGEDGRLLLPDGTGYRVLVLPRTRRMRAEVLRKVKELALGGAVVLGPKPEQSPTLAGGREREDAEVRALADEVWGDLDGVQRTRRAYGRGTVAWGVPLAELLASAGIAPDAEFDRPLDAEISWIHRRSEGAEIYFVANRTDRPLEIRGRFRVAGKEAELWHPDTGERAPAGYAIEGERTTVPLHLEERESVFVVFRRPAADPARTISRPVYQTVAALDGPWDVAFPPGWGAPERMRMERLEPYAAHPGEGVKYFSGTAVYTKTFRLAPEEVRSGRVFLDLGKVGDVAEVWVNGRRAALLWKPPYRAGVGAWLKAGENRLEIRVTNQWSNRMLGDRALPPEGKRLPPPPAWMERYAAPAALARSGLLGPVVISSAAGPE